MIKTDNSKAIVGDSKTSAKSITWIEIHDNTNWV